MFKSLAEGPLDIVGDVHGEREALASLLAHLGYDEQGRHPEGRRLVFIGDLCDRGPDSPGVVDTVRRIVEAGRGDAVLGNHELNLLRGERKDGNDWFWGEGTARDRKYGSVRQPSASERAELLRFFASLPLALERPDLRLVHAAWHEPSLARLKQAGLGGLLDSFNHFERQADQRIQAEGWATRAAQEKAAWAHALHDSDQPVPVLHAVAATDEIRQMGNPVRVLISGIERKGREPFFSSGQWRFVERVKWWDEYEDDVPVVVGHYWRRLAPVDRARLGKGDPDLFGSTAPTAWHGARKNVFCVDYSVGGRYRERLDGKLPGTDAHLAALRWPEQTLVTDTGLMLATTLE
jgi:hypothetical protein